MEIHPRGARLWSPGIHVNLTRTLLSLAGGTCVAFTAISGTAGEPELIGRKQPMRRAAYRIAAKLRIIDGARLTRPYIYY